MAHPAYDRYRITGAALIIASDAFRAGASVHTMTVLNAAVEAHDEATTAYMAEDDAREAMIMREVRFALDNNRSPHKAHTLTASDEDDVHMAAMTLGYETEQTSDEDGVEIEIFQANSRENSCEIYLPCTPTTTTTTTNEATR